MKVRLLQSISKMMCVQLLLLLHMLLPLLLHLWLGLLLLFTSPVLTSRVLVGPPHQCP